MENNNHDWITLMRHGDWPTAWQCSDATLASRVGKSCWHLPRHLQYIWNGESLAGKRVLARCYHGLGDTIQFIRYAVLLKQIAAEVIVWVQPKLIPLLKTAAGIDQLLPLHDGTPEVDYDVDVELMELPHVFRSTPGTIPASIPYIHSNSYQLKKAGRLAVGLVWKSGNWDDRRSMPFLTLYPLKEIENADFYILQPGAMAAGWQHEFGIYSGEFDITEYAKYIAGLHLLISIDSMPVHLAGALGIPVWTMLQADADWRWMKDPSDSPWYPTMRLFRQAEPGNWDSVIMEVKTELEKLSTDMPENALQMIHLKKS